MVADRQPSTQAETPAKKTVPLPEHAVVSQGEFLQMYRATLIEAVARSAPPIYQGPDSTPFVRLSMLKRKLKGAQTLNVLAGAMGIRGLKAHGDRPARPPVRGLGEIAEMSVGKTIISLATLAMADEGITGKIMPDDQRPIKSQFYPALMLVPPTLPEKWLREARDTLPMAKPVILRAVQTRDELRAFRQFDPNFGGTKLSGVACVDRVVARIKADLQAWRRACEDQRYRHLGIPQAEIECWRNTPRYPICGIIPPAEVGAWRQAQATARAEGRDVLPEERRRWERACRAKRERLIVDPAAEARWHQAVTDARQRRQSALKAWRDDCTRAARDGQELPERPTLPPPRLPAKPAHIGVITYDGAKMGSPWRPAYILRVLRAPGEGGKVQAVRDPETGEMVVVPCCPQCAAPITADESQQRKRERSRRQPEATASAEAGVAQEQMEESPYLSEADLLGEEGKRSKHRCTACGTPLWQTIPEGVTWQACSPPIAQAQQMMSEVTPWHRMPVEVDAESVLSQTVQCYRARLAWLSDEEFTAFVERHAAKIRHKRTYQRIWNAVAAEEFLRRLAMYHQEIRAYLRSQQAFPIPDRPGEFPVLRDVRSRKIPLADYLRRRYRGVFCTLVTDEAHKVSGSGTAQGFAAASLFDACGSGGTSVFMTGTLFSGYASGLFPLLWRLMPEIRSEFGYSDLARWVDRYGVRQKVTKVSEKQLESGAKSKRRQNDAVPRELPGLSPLALQHLLPTCLFLELADVAPDLPSFTEEVIAVPMGDELGRAYREFEHTTSAELKRLLWEGDNSATSPWFQSLMVYPNLPFKELRPTARRSNTVLGISQALPAERSFPKEAELCRQIRDARRRHRRVLIFVEHTQEHDLIPRLTDVLARDDAQWQEDDPATYPGHPIRIVTLRSETVSAIKREAWLNQQVEVGCDVLICHSGLVEVGLDLLAFPSIFAYEVIFSTSRLRQATRRSWRIGQIEPVEVKYFVYENTMEARGLHLIATKMMSSLLIEGKLPGDGLAMQADTSGSANLILELAKSVLAEADSDAMATVADLKRSFVELQRVGTEQESFISDVTIPAALPEEIVASDPALESTEPMTPIQSLPAAQTQPIAAEATTPHRYTWEEWRALALQQKATRATKRRKAIAADPTVFPEGSLWALLPAASPSPQVQSPPRSTLPPSPSTQDVSQLSLFD